MFDKNEQEISQIIEESLAAILAGEASMGDVLRKHSKLAAILQPEIEAALWLVARKQQVEPRPGFSPASRKRIVERIKQESLSRGTGQAFVGSFAPKPRFAFQWIAVIIFLIVLIAGTGGLLSVSQGALPGDQLYTVKRTAEDIAIRLTWNDVRKADLRAEFIERRIQEVEALVENGKYTEAAEALSEFEQEVSQAVLLLQQVGDKELEMKSALAGQMQADLTAFAQRLDALQLNAPENFRARLARAGSTSMNGASVATDIYKDAQEKKSVKDKAGQDKPQAVETSQPADTGQPITDPGGDGGRITKTPKPANENRPEKEAIPTPDTKPTKVPKPTKEDKDK